MQAKVIKQLYQASLTDSLNGELQKALNPKKNIVHTPGCSLLIDEKLFLYLLDLP